MANLVKTLMSGKTTFVMVLVLATIVMYFMLTLATSSGNGVLTGILVLAVSPIGFTILALVLETGPVDSGGRGTTFKEVVKNIFSTKIQAKSFVYGDTLILPWAFITAADKWNQSSIRGELMIGWHFAGFIIGVAAGLVFHHVLEKRAYTKRGQAAYLDSPTKLFHDLVSYPVLCGGMIYAFFPLLFATGLNLHTFQILGLVTVWFFLSFKVDKENAATMSPWGNVIFDWTTWGIKEKRVK